VYNNVGGDLVKVPPAIWMNRKQFGFYARITSTDSGATLLATDGACILLSPSPEKGEKFRAINASNFVWEEKIKNSKDEGLYNVFFVNCAYKEFKVSFDLHVQFYNKDGNEKNYLSAGDAPLPTIYGLLSIVYIGIIVVWIFGFMRNSGTQVVHVNRLHYGMTVLVLVKCFSLISQTFEYHFLKTTGSTQGWNIPYYIFTFLKGIMLFTVILLIGTGWAFVKPFISDRDKKVFLLVIPLQLLANVALVIVDETTPSSVGWLTWKEVFQFVDIICCGAILIPIIWSIKHLKEASETDGKAARNMMKLKLFRQFYLMVVAYVYFTRIIVILMNSTLPFYVLWLAPLATEVATLLFFTVTGWKFRPAQDNPYFKLEDESGIQLKELVKDDRP